jgi:hypothetical protein
MRVTRRVNDRTVKEGLAFLKAKLMVVPNGRNPRKNSCVDVALHLMAKHDTVRAWLAEMDKYVATNPLPSSGTPSSLLLFLYREGAITIKV